MFYDIYSSPPYAPDVRKYHVCELQQINRYDKINYMEGFHLSGGLCDI